LIKINRDEVRRIAGNVTKLPELREIYEPSGGIALARCIGTTAVMGI
jgi:hypothetical protein